MRILPILLLSCSIAGLAAADFPSDVELLTMAKRRIEARDLGFNVEQQIVIQRGLHQDPLPNAAPTIVTRGTVTADQRLPVRFQVMVNNVRTGGEKQQSSVIIDAWIKRDDFGTWSMEWRYNMDQTLLALETQKAVISAAMATDPDSAWRNTLPKMLLSGIFPAQRIFQEAKHEDRDGNGIGDFASDLEVLSGTRIVKQAKEPLRLIPESLMGEWAKAGIKYSLLADNERGFWMFAVLPSGSKTYAISAAGMLREFDGSVIPTSVDEAKTAIARGTAVRR